ncbi:unnamed protein product [Phytophthora lilii]|uniref:Unnamed protein product n=1 Tax=Phytophthora lilii TaxID=2077276 RepID=A0A9W6TZ51_9STRA|nr:unnamed protein product [Phytophthora lilii]
MRRSSRGQARSLVDGIAAWGEGDAMDERWGVCNTQDERLRLETITNSDEKEQEPTMSLGKRHPATSPAGLDEVLALSARGGDNGSVKSDEAQEATAKPKHPRKHRKSTHVVRKRLLKEMAVLNAQLESLKQQAMASMEHVDQDTARSIQVGRELRDDVQANQQRFGETASVMSEFSRCCLTITQLKDAHNVKQIYDLLLFYYCNLEISISEKIGHITVRSDDDNGNKSITQNRLVSTTIKDIKVESNTLTFAQFHERSKGQANIYGDGDCAMIVMDYADDDEKYPYQPGECIRKDIVAVIEIRECTSNVDDKPMVVLTKWVQNKLRRPLFPVKTKDWYELRDRMDLFGKTMQRSLVEDLHIQALGLAMTSD